MFLLFLSTNIWIFPSICWVSYKFRVKLRPVSLWRAYVILLCKFLLQQKQSIHFKNGSVKSEKNICLKLFAISFNLMILSYLNYFGQCSKIISNSSIVHSMLSMLLSRKNQIFLNNSPYLRASEFFQCLSIYQL